MPIFIRFPITIHQVLLGLHTGDKNSHFGIRFFRGIQDKIDNFILYFLVFQNNSFN